MSEDWIWIPKKVRGNDFDKIAVKADVNTGELVIHEIRLHGNITAESFKKVPMRAIKNHLWKLLAPKLNIPKQTAPKMISDEFLRQIVIYYEQCVVMGLPPKKTIAELYEVHPKTAQRWIRFARDRELFAA